MTLELLKSKLKALCTEKELKTITAIEGRGGLPIGPYVTNPTYLEPIAEELYSRIKKLDSFQLAGLETAALPLLTAILLLAKADGKQVNGFYIRKSRKKTGQFNVIEGTVTKAPVVLVDDVINSGHSILWQLAQLDKLSLKATHCLTAVQYHDTNHYPHLTEAGLQLESIWNLNDLGLSHQEQTVTHRNLSARWKHEVDSASHIYVTTKSVPCLSSEALFYGTDSGLFYCLDRASGEVRWTVQTGLPSLGKNIFSAPCIDDTAVYFGSYDGKFYALKKTTGEVLWTHQGADWIGSSPTVNPSGETVYVGLEHSGPGSRRGSLVALNTVDGTVRWEYDMFGLTHASPLLLPEHNQVVIGSNAGVIHCLEADTGAVIWKFETAGGRVFDGVGGFSLGDIKMHPVYDAETDQLAVASMDGHVYVLDRSTGEMQFRCATKEAMPGDHLPIYGSPIFYGEGLYFGSTDKQVYGVDKRTGADLWKINTGARVFSTPTIHNGELVIGSNNGRLYYINPETGELAAVSQTTDRITSEVLFDNDDLVVLHNDNSVTCFSTPTKTTT